MKLFTHRTSHLGVLFLALILFVMLLVLSSGCSAKEKSVLHCTQYVNLEILNLEDLHAKQCYTTNGQVRLILFNGGHVPIHSFILDIVGSQGRFTKELGIYVAQDQVLPLEIAFPMKELGSIQSIAITPKIKYDNASLTCSWSKRIISSLEPCMDSLQR
ncbi:MAG: hypothetical protein QW594_01780 [Candidatus Woesearchaeota archaeon]